MISDNNEPEDTHYEAFEKELLPPSTGSAEIFRNFLNLFTIQRKQRTSNTRADIQT